MLLLVFSGVCFSRLSKYFDSTKPYHCGIFFPAPWGSEHTSRFQEHQLPCYWNLYLSCKSETTSPVLPTVPKRYCHIQSDLGHTCVNACPPKVNFIAAVAFVVLQEIPRLINELSHHLSDRVISVAVLMYTSAIHRLQRRWFPKLNGMNENIPPPPVPSSCNSIKTHHKSTSLLAVQLPCIFHNKTHRSVYCFLFMTHSCYQITSESTSGPGTSYRSHNPNRLAASSYASEVPAYQTYTTCLTFETGLLLLTGLVLHSRAWL